MKILYQVFPQCWPEDTAQWRVHAWSLGLFQSTGNQMGWLMHATPVFRKRRQEDQDFQDYPQLYSEFEASLGYLETCLKKKKISTGYSVVEGRCTLPWTIILHEPSAPSSCMQPWWGKSWFLFSHWCRSPGEAQTCSPAVFLWTPWDWQPLGPCCSTLLPLQRTPLAAERSLSWTNRLRTSMLFCRRTHNLFWGNNSSKSLDFSLQCFIKSFFIMFFSQAIQPSKKKNIYWLSQLLLLGHCLVLHTRLGHCAWTLL